MKITPIPRNKTRILMVFSMASLAAILAVAAQRNASSRSLPQFEYRLLDGSLLRTADLKGKVAVIDFWGTWCGPCIKEIPDYNRFYSERKNRGLVLLGLAVDSGTEEEVRAAAKKLAIGYPVAAPKLQQLDVFGDIGAIPTTWVIDREGKVAKVFVGEFVDKQRQLREIVDRLLQ
jgi:peroxiredoxin